MLIDTHSLANSPRLYLLPLGGVSQSQQPCSPSPRLSSLAHMILLTHLHFFSRFQKHTPPHHRPEVDRMDKQLQLFSATLEAWLLVQRGWLKLEAVFAAPDIQRQVGAAAVAGRRS